MLKIDHLSVEYFRRGQTLPAVQDISFSIDSGETVGLVGESGSGKSTIALAILRLIRPQEGRISAGHIFFHEKDLLTISDEEMRAIRGKRISMIFQDPFTSLNPVMRIHEQMAETGTSGSLSEALERVQLDASRMLNSYPHQLSGGQRQRVMIAMALLGNPELLLADEPTTALDVIVQKEILDLLFRLQKELKMGLLLISHNLDLVGHYTQRMLVMQEGALVEEQPTPQLFRSPRNAYTQRLLKAIPRLK